jgi:hypothetical protein
MNYICEKFRNEKNRNMENPFKFGTIVDGEFFTDRTEELKYVHQILNSENHLVLISPRRFGKTSLVHKAALETERPMLFLNLEAVTDKRDFALALLKRLFKLYPLERIKHLMKNFRFVPTLSMTPTGDSIDVSLMPQVDDNVVLEDVMALQSQNFSCKQLEISHQQCPKLSHRVVPTISDVIQACEFGYILNKRKHTLFLENTY